MQIIRLRPSLVLFMVLSAGLALGACDSATSPADGSANEDANAPDGEGGAGDDAGDTSDAGTTDAGADPGPANADGGADLPTDGGDGSGDPAQDGGGDGDGGQEPPLFDLAQIRDPATAQCTFSNPRTVIQEGVLVDAWNLSYVSWESRAGVLQPILIRAFAAMPANASAVLPGVVRAHGLGGFAEEADAATLAARLSTFVVAYTGPGGGNAPDNTSEGLPATDGNGYRMFDTLQDLRASWFWAHTVAGLRALTCLETRGEVDPARLGMTGFSAGAVATLLAAGADDRIKAAVPMSGTGAWDVATRSPQAWQHSLLSGAGLSVASPEWLRLIEGMITPAVMVGHSSTPILMINGSVDEFFPLTAFLATFQAIPGQGQRLSIAGNFDHGCYQLAQNADTIEARADLHAQGGMRMWFGHHFGTDGDFAQLPEPPVLSVQPAGSIALVAAVVDETPTALEVEEVTFWWSNDDCYVFLDQTLEKDSGVWQAWVPISVQANSVYFLDVQYKTKDLLLPKRFTLSSPPVIPEDLIPHIRDMSTCQ